MKRARIQTKHNDPECIVAAISPDNTAEMEMAAGDESVTTRIERKTTGGLRSNLDDYLVNVIVAERTLGLFQTETHTTTDTSS